MKWSFGVWILGSGSFSLIPGVEVFDGLQKEDWERIR